MSNNRTGFIWVIMAAVGYACLPIFTRSIYANSSLIPTDIALVRFMLATPAIWVLLLLRRQFQGSNGAKRNHPFPPWRQAFLGFLYAGAALSAFSGLQYVPASLYVVLFYTYPAMVTIISRFLGERIPRVGWIALASTLIGVFLTLPDFSIIAPEMGAGILIALLNALLVATYFIIVGKLTRRGAEPMLGTAYVISGTLVILALVSPFVGGVSFPETPSVWGLLIGLGIISTALPILFMQIGIQHIGAPVASIISTFEPVLSMTLAMLILGETILPTQWMGAAFIIAGVIILQTSRMRKPRMAT